MVSEVDGEHVNWQNDMNTCLPHSLAEWCYPTSAPGYPSLPHEPLGGLAPAPEFST